MNSTPVELGNQIKCRLLPNIQLVKFERLKTTVDVDVDVDVDEPIFELALVDHRKSFKNMTWSVQDNNVQNFVIISKYPLPPEFTRLAIKA